MPPELRARPYRPTPRSPCPAATNPPPLDTPALPAPLQPKHPDTLPAPLRPGRKPPPPSRALDQSTLNPNISPLRRFPTLPQPRNQRGNNPPTPPHTAPSPPIPPDPTQQPTAPPAPLPLPTSPPNSRWAARAISQARCFTRLPARLRTASSWTCANAPKEGLLDAGLRASTILGVRSTYVAFSSRSSGCHPALQKTQNRFPSPYLTQSHFPSSIRFNGWLAFESVCRETVLSRAFALAGTPHSAGVVPAPSDRGVTPGLQPNRALQLTVTRRPARACS